MLDKGQKTSNNLRSDCLDIYPDTELVRHFIVSVAVTGMASSSIVDIKPSLI